MEQKNQRKKWQKQQTMGSEKKTTQHENWN